MKKFVLMDYEMKQVMGMESHQYICERFSKEKVVKNTIEKIFAKGM